MSLNISAVILNIIAIVLWIFVGLFNLIKKKPIDKFSYFVLWFAFIINYILETIQQSLS